MSKMQGSIVMVLAACSMLITTASHQNALWLVSVVFWMIGFIYSL